MSNFQAPKIGCQHFKTIVKQIRSDNNTIESALYDIIDNVYGIAKAQCLVNTECRIKITYSENSMDKIIISDNIPKGFTKILDNGVDNPLNMGHIRIGHDDDNESSEFGTGLKKGMIFLSKDTEIYTRSVMIMIVLTM
jgi:hypothetical protein